MIHFIFIKELDRTYSQPSNLISRGKNWELLFPLLFEIWGQPSKINYLRVFLNQEALEDNYDCTGFNNGSFVEDNADGFIIIGSQWSEGYEFRFPKEKFKHFLDVLDETSKHLYPMPIYKSPDLLQFIIDDEWDTRIEQVYLNADTSFFEKDGSGMPQCRFERVKGHQYKLVQNDCADNPASLVLGTFIEDVWIDPKILDKSVDFKNDSEDGVMHYGKTFLKKEGDQFTLGIQGKNNLKYAVSFSKKIIHRILVLNELFLNSVHDASLDKLPGVIFFTFDEYWNLIPVPLFRPEDKNFVDKE